MRMISMKCKKQVGTIGRLAAGLIKCDVRRQCVIEDNERGEFTKTMRRWIGW